MSANSYQIVFARSARKELDRLDATVTGRIMHRIEALSTEPRPAGSKKLVASKSLWRIRVGDYRVIYGIDDGSRIVDVTSVRHRRDAYR